MRRVFFVIALLCLLAPSGALASKKGGQRVIADCSDADGEITGRYTQSDYQWALDHLPTDLDQYSNCRDAIRAAQRAGAGGGRRSGGGGGGGGAGPLPPSPALPSPPAVPAAHTAPKVPKSATPVNVGGGPPITPGGPGITTTSFTRAVPGSLLVVIALLALAALGRAGPAIRSRVLARRQG